MFSCESRSVFPSLGLRRECGLQLPEFSNSEALLMKEQAILRFIEKILQNSFLYRTTICNLYTMPRITEPVWLTMMSGMPEKNQLCHHFMKEFTFLMEQASRN
ncbi:hypothetical protein E2320_015451, partial [Naja naja]